MNPERFYRLMTIFLTVGMLGLLMSCAASSTTVIEEEVVTNAKPMYMYKSLLIRDFELKREIYSDVPEDRMSEREKRYARLPQELAGHIERYVRAHRTYRSVSRSQAADAETLILNGRFTRVGRFKISVSATLNDGASGQEVALFRQTLWDVFDTTESVNQLGRDLADFIDRIQYK